MVMNRIVRERYPISRLRDLREAVDPNGMAVVTAIERGETRASSKGLDAITDYRRKHRPRYQSDEEIVDLVRRIRDGDAL